MIILSSTIRTLIGGTAAFSIPVGNDGLSALLGFPFLRAAGRGEDIRGGGVCVRGIGTRSLVGAGGVGSGGAIGGTVDFSEALE